MLPEKSLRYQLLWFQYCLSACWVLVAGTLSLWRHNAILPPARTCRPYDGMVHLLTLYGRAS